MRTRIVLLGLIAWMLSGCTLEPKREHLLEFSFQKKPDTALQYLQQTLFGEAPSAVKQASGSASVLGDSLSGFSCLAVNVVGPSIPPSVPSGPVNMTGLMSGATSCAYRGIIAGPISSSLTASADYQLVVPSGRHLIQVLGINNPDQCKVPVGAGSGEVGAYEVGRAVADVFSDVSVSISNAYDATAPKRIDCGTCSGPAALQGLMAALEVPSGNKARQIFPLKQGMKVYGVALKVAGTGSITARLLSLASLPGTEVATATLSPASDAPVWLNADFSNAPVEVAANGLHAIELSSTSSFKWFGGSRPGNGMGRAETDLAGPFSPVTSQGAGLPSHLTVGPSNSCLISNGKLYCWGKIQTGFYESPYNGSKPVPGMEMGVSKAGATLSDPRVPMIPTRVFVGADHACTLAAPVGGVPNEALCWGNNANGQVGTLTASQVSPERVFPTRTFRMIRTGNAFTCGITDGATTGVADGTVLCWGSNASLQLGAGAIGTPNLGSFLSPALEGPAIQLSTGDNHACAVVAKVVNGVQTQIVQCWGARSGLGKLGDGGTGTAPSIPVAVVTGAVSPVVMTDVKQVVTGADFSCALKFNGEVWCWGSNSVGQLGISPATTNPSFVAVKSSLTGVTDLAAGAQHVCAIQGTASSGTGNVYCWGQGSLGQLGNGASASSATPVRVGPSGSPLTWARHLAISSLSNTSCAVVGPGDPVCWGNNEFGQLGVGTFGTGNKRNLPIEPALFNAFAHEVKLCP